MEFAYMIGVGPKASPRNPRCCAEPCDVQAADSARRPDAADRGAGVAPASAVARPATAPIVGRGGLSDVPGCGPAPTLVRAAGCQSEGVWGDEPQGSCAQALREPTGGVGTWKRTRGTDVFRGTPLFAATLTSPSCVVTGSGRGGARQALPR